jgi:hypothetical protein
LEQDKEGDGFAHPAGKRPRKEPLFGGALQKMETGSDFATGLKTSHRETISLFRTSGRVTACRIVVTPDRQPPSPSLLDRSQRRNQSAAHGSNKRLV